MILALVLAAAGASAPASKAAALVPAEARAALLLDGEGATSGFRALLEVSGRRAPMTSPDSAGRDLRRAIGVDLLGGSAAWGLAPQGTRALVFAAGSVALTAPLKDAAKARLKLKDWLAGGPKRAATIAKGRLLIGSGPRIGELLRALAHPKPSLARDRAFRTTLAASGAALFFRGPEPLLRGGVFGLDASAEGLIARGLVLPPGDAALLGTAAPVPCAGSPLACARADLGPAGRALVAAAFREYLSRALPPGPRDLLDGIAQRLTGKAALQVAALDAHRLGDARDSLFAARFSAAAETTATLPAQLPAGVSRTATGLTIAAERPLCAELAQATAALSSPCAPAPELRAGSSNALDVAIDLIALDGALSRLGPLDALKGEVAAGAYGAHLLFGPLLRNAGPLAITGRAAGTAAAIELRLPLH